MFIDDFSKDDTFELLKNYSKKYYFIKVFKNKKKGLGPAIEEGIKKSKLNYVSIFMSDSSDSVSDLIKYYKIISKYKTSTVLNVYYVKNNTLWTKVTQIKFICTRGFVN